MKGLRIFLIIVLVVICSGALFFAVKGTTNNDNGTTNNSTPSTDTQKGYTSEDLQNAYNEGYEDAGGDKVRLDEIVAENDTLVARNSELLKQTQQLTEKVTTLTNERDLLIAERSNYNSTIAEYQDTISSLNIRIVALNNQITDLNTQISDNLLEAAGYNTRIADLQRTIAFYEQFVVQFETEDQALVTFEFAGSVYDGKVVNKGDHVMTTTPESSEYIIFNGWVIDGEPIDLATYVVTESVRITADVTYKYLVNFNVDGVTKSSQIVENGQFPEEPTKPKKNGFTFKYWTLDGEHEVDVTQCVITANTTFIAKFNPLFTVTFEVEGEIVANRRIEYGDTTTSLVITPPDGKGFNGWLLDGVIVDVSHYVITQDTNFVADLRDYLTVRYMYYTVNSSSYLVGDHYVQQQVMYNNTPEPVTDPAITDYTFIGWSVDKVNVIDTTQYKITEDTWFYAVLRHKNYLQTYTVTFYNYLGKVGYTTTVSWGTPVINLPPAELTPSSYNGKKFYGWDTSPQQGSSYSITSLYDYVVTKNITFYPVYGPIIIA